jgi:hypothetical protein
VIYTPSTPQIRESHSWLLAALVTGLTGFRTCCHSAASCHGPIYIAHGQGTCLHEDMIRKALAIVGLLFRRLATLRLDAAVFDSLDGLRWKGPPLSFEEQCRVMGSLMCSIAPLQLQGNTLVQTA